MHAPFCWLTMVPRASIVTTYSLLASSFGFKVAIEANLHWYMVYNSITSLHATSTHVHNVLSLYSISHPPPTVFVGISPRHRDPTSFTSSSAEICQPKTSHATTLRARPKLHRRMTCYFRLKASCFQHERLEGHTSFWQLNSFAISWNFSTTTFMEKSVSCTEDTHTLFGCACVKTHHALRLRHRESLFKGKISKVGTWHMTAFLPWALMCENVYVPWLRGNHTTHVWVLKQEHPCQEIKLI